MRIIRNRRGSRTGERCGYAVGRRRPPGGGVCPPPVDNSPGLRVTSPRSVFRLVSGGFRSGEPVPRGSRSSHDRSWVALAAPAVAVSMDELQLSEEFPACCEGFDVVGLGCHAVACWCVVVDRFAALPTWFIVRSSSCDECCSSLPVCAVVVHAHVFILSAGRPCCSRCAARDWAVTC